MDMQIGEQAILGWNSAKQLNCEENMGENVRLESIGHDWLVFRDTNGRAYAIDFESYSDKIAFIRTITC